MFGIVLSSSISKAVTCNLGPPSFFWWTCSQSSSPSHSLNRVLNSCAWQLWSGIYTLDFNWLSLQEWSGLLPPLWSSSYSLPFIFSSSCSSGVLASLLTLRDLSLDGPSSSLYPLPLAFPSAYKLFPSNLDWEFQTSPPKVKFLWLFSPKLGGLHPSPAYYQSAACVSLLTKLRSMDTYHSSHYSCIGLFIPQRHWSTRIVVFYMVRPQE